MLRCGLLGEKLGHSYSPAIHALLGEYTYKLYEKKAHELPEFLTAGDFDGLNVTIPYKKAVIPYCDSLSESAARTGAVNTLVRRADGTLYGDNTDVYGFSYLLESSGIDATGKKALVLGSGGASAAVCAALGDLGAASAIVISRKGENHYGNLDRHADADLIVNTTPVGMYPENGAAPLDLTAFPNCRGVLDVVYNPLRTALVLQAEELGIPCDGGLLMLAAQAKRSSELFTGKRLDDGIIERVYKNLLETMENIVLIGMPGSGKSSTAKLLAERTGRMPADSDEEIVRRSGMSIPEIFSQYGEEEFRRRESAVLKDLGKRSGIILSAGGGCVLREENYGYLRQNGRIVWIYRDLDALETEGRPLSLGTDLREMFRRRSALYERFADIRIENNGTLEQTAEKIEERLVIR